MTATASARVRHARPADLPGIAALAAEHAAYEKAVEPPADLPQRLEKLLFGQADPPRLSVFVAELGDDLVGYASCAPEVSTWDGDEYLHMDCLFLRSGHRGLGIGPMLMAAVVADARTRGLDRIQWQTPSWNTDAIRFYDRLGARATEKLRYSLLLDVEAD
ncbi:N-acetyltransferase family protein [Streptomyces sp. NPDC002776]